MEAAYITFTCRSGKLGTLIEDDDDDTDGDYDDDDNNNII